MKNVIQSNDLTKKYGNYAAVNKVNFTLRDGEIYGLIGKNGAGKSTYLKMLMGLANPTSGNIEINGHQTQSALNKERHQIGFMMEPAFFPYMTAYNNIKYFARLKGITDKAEIERVLKLTDMYGVKKPFKAYSMGMKQRLALANAMVGNPKIVVLDEPINGLDPEGIADFRKLILRLNKENGQTFIVSSHILSELALMASRFGFIDKGVLLQEMSQEDLHAQCQKSLIVKTDDAQKTLALVQETHPDAQINAKDEVVVNNFENNGIELIAQKLFENNQKLYKLVAQETTLEEYFFNLIGGHDNA